MNNKSTFAHLIRVIGTINHVCMSEGEEVFDGAVQMTLCSKEDDSIYVFLLHQLVNGLEVLSVHLYELLVGPSHDVFNVSEVS